MPRSSPIQVAFNSGELSPKMAGRVDQDRYRAGCHRLENFIPDIAGPAVKRGGTYYVAAVKSPSKRTWLVRFEFSPTESFIIEFGDGYLRFFNQRAPVLSAGIPYEIAAPWTEAQLTNEAGGFAISFVQSGDIIYLAHRSHQTRKLSRLGTTNWTLTNYEPTGGPFKDLNITAKTVYADANTGATTLHASSAIFTSAMIGTLFYLEQQTVSGTKQWEVAKTVSAADVRRSESRNYQTAAGGTTGAVRPTHTEGTVSDGDPGVLWEFLDAGYGWGRITAIGGGGTTASLTVLSRLPDEAVGSGNASTKWAFSAWSDAEGWPDCVTFYLDRLAFARDSTVWMSVAGDYENMQAREFGRQLTASAIILPIPSRRGNPILWLETLETGLIVGTGADEWVVSPASRNDPLGPLNVACNPLGAIGSRAIPVVRLFDAIVFTQRSGKKLRDLRYVVGDGAIRSDLNALADHITDAGFTSIAYTAEPYSILWACDADGALSGLVYYPEQEVLAWGRFPLDGFVECVQTIPAPDGRVDDLWLVVRRTINGAETRYIEWMKAPLSITGAQEDAFYVDAGATYQGLPATTIPGFDHLIGETINLLVNGATHPARTVNASGEVTLQLPGTKVHGGLPLVAKVATMDIESGSANGTAQGKLKRVHRGIVRLFRTLGGKAGPGEDKLDALSFRTAPMPMGSPPPLYTGDKPVPWPGGSDRSAKLWFVHEEPTPATVVAFMPDMSTED